MVVKLLRIVSELTSVHEDFPKCMPEVLCAWKSRESVKLMVDEVQILLWTFNPPFTRVRIPPYVIITYRQWFGKPESAKEKTVHFMCARTFLKQTVALPDTALFCIGSTFPALPENRYRNGDIQVKRYLSAWIVTLLKCSAV